MSRTDPQFNLRIPESLRDLVMAAAKENKRSATAEILARLERGFTETDELGISDQGRLSGEAFPLRSERVIAGVDKDVLIKTTEADTPITRADLYGAIDMAIDHALGKLGIGPKAEPNTGPKPKKLRPKE